VRGRGSIAIIGVAIIALSSCARKRRVAAAPSSPELWEAYRQFDSRFYRLQTLEFNTVSCRLTSAQWDTFDRFVHDSSKRFPVRITGTFPVGRVVYSRSKGLELTLPTFDVDVVSYEGVTDRARFDGGLKQLKDGGHGVIDGLGKMVRAIFGYLEAPDPARTSVKAVSLDRLPTASVHTNGVDITYVLDGHRLSSTQTGPALKVQSLDEFSSMPKTGQLLYQSTSATITTPGSTTTFKDTVQYQEVFDVVFPARVHTWYFSDTMGMKQEVTVDFSLDDCVRT
jgi:hypothetical protein